MTLTELKNDLRKIVDKIERAEDEQPVDGVKELLDHVYQDLDGILVLFSQTSVRVMEAPIQEF